MAKVKTYAPVTPEEQPYALPEGWEWVRLGEICKIVTGKEDANFADENGEYFFYTCAEFPNLCNKYVFEGDSVLIAGNGDFHVNFYDGKFNAYQRTYVLQNFIGTSAKYVYYHTLRNIQEITSGHRGSTIRYIRLSDLTDSFLPLPPFATQQRIIAHIESLFSKLDRAKELAQSALDKFETRRATILHKAFTGELTAAWRREHGVGDESWEVKRFDEVADIKSNLVDPRKYPDFPHIAPDNIEKHTGVLLKYFTIAEDCVTSGKHRFYPGQIIYSKIRPYLSKLVVVDFDGLCSADMYPIEAKGNTHYLWYYMLSEEFLEQASTAGSRSVLPKINQKELSALKVPITSLPEQREIVRILDKLFEQEQKAKELGGVVEKIELMKKAILARAFREELQ